MLKLTVTKQALTAAIGDVLPFVERKTTIPILANVLVQTREDGTIAITGTDLDKSLTVQLPANIKNEGKITITAHKLAKTLQNLKLIESGTVTVTELENHWIELQCGDFKVKLPGMSANSYPSLPKLTEQQWNMGNVIQAEVLSHLIGTCRHAIADQESRYTLNGGLLVITDEAIRMVATDGHRLVNCSCNRTSYRGGVRTLIHREALDRIAKLVAGSDSLVEFATSDDTATGTAGTQFFRADNWVMTSRTLTGQFPNYDAVIPKQDHARLKVYVNAQELAKVVKRVGMYSDERSGAIKLELVPALGVKVMASSTEQGDASEVIQCAIESKDSMAKTTIGLDHRYVLDLLSTFKKDGMVVLLVRDEHSATLWQPLNGGEYKADYVVMPMRV